MGKRKQRKATEVRHYLLTMMVGPMYLHSYVMTDDQRSIEPVMHDMCDRAEVLAKKHGYFLMPAVMQTELSDGGHIPDPESIAQVRKHICGLDPEVEGALRSATNFHRTMWMLREDHPDNPALMALH